MISNIFETKILEKGFVYEFFIDNSEPYAFSLKGGDVTMQVSAYKRNGQYSYTNIFSIDNSEPWKIFQPFKCYNNWLKIECIIFNNPTTFSIMGG